MNVKSFGIEGPLLLQPKIFEDDRGFFTERFRLDTWNRLFPRHGGFMQDNYSWSKYGVLRGLHYQFNPDQGKLVSCIEGSIVDVIVDIRMDSPTLGQHLKVELNAQRPSWFWVPPGFAHSFVVTSSSGAGVLYKVDAPYNPQTEGAIHYNDPDLKIEWPLATPILSSKDNAAKSFSHYLATHKQK